MDRETAIEAVGATASVLLFVGAAIAIGLLHGDGDRISSTGGLLIIAAITGFILVMTLFGVLLDRR